MKRKRRVLSPSFKSKVALAAIQEKIPVSELARIYDVQPTQVSAWKNTLIDRAGSIFENNASTSTKREEFKTLLAKIGELTLENEMLTEKLHILNPQS